MPFKLAPRLSAFDYIGCHQYFLTICTRDRTRVFMDDDAVAGVVLELLRTSDAQHFSVIAYCLMPDHIHVLAEGTEPAADFRQFVRSFKQQSSFQWKRRTGRPLWQRSYFEHVLRSDEDTVGLARYILENPVRAGLAARPEDYPYLGSMTVSVRDLLYSVQM